MNRADQCILVVDDEELNIQLLTCYFKKTNYKVIIANTGNEALDKMQEIHPDLVLLDIQMPGINGIEVLRIAKSTEGIKDIPIIMLTASGTKDYMTKSFELGATAFFIRPIDFTEIINEIKKAIDFSSNSHCEC